MKKIFSSFAVMGLLFASVIPSVTLAQSSNSPSAQSKERIVVLSASETINGNYFNAGNSVTISGKVNGDVYVAGGSVIVDGTVNGDVLAAGGTVIVRGKVTQNVRVAGGNIDISGTIGRNVTTLGGTITISDGAKISGSVVSAGGNVIVMASVPKGVDAAGGQLTLGNKVGGNVQAAVGQFILTPNASVAGNLTYWSNHEATMQSGARVAGAIHRYSSPVPESQKQAENTLKATVIISKIIGFLTAAVIGLLLVFLLPNFMGNAATVVMKKPWAAIGWGLTLTALIPFSFLILLITVVGIPLAFILLFLYILAAYLGKFLVIYAFGVWLAGAAKTKMHVAWAFTLGLLIYEIIKFIPIIGFILGVMVFFMGIGTIFLEKRRLYADLRKEKYL